MSTATSPKKIKNAWAMYDWANSAYNLVITSTIFPTYYMVITRSKQADSLDYVSFFGWKIINSSLLNYALAFAYLIIAFLSPILSSIADFKGNKKRFMQFFSLLGSLACVGLYFFTENRIELGVLFAIVAAIGYCGSLVFYNAYLPEIAAVNEQDKLSAKGFALGYIGSVLLQLICLVFILNPSNFNFIGIYNEGDASRFSFLLTGIWWFGFSQISFKYLPNNSPPASNSSSNKPNIFQAGFKELGQVWTQVKKMQVLKNYLLAFFFYSMAVQTVMLAAAEFASKEIKQLVNGEWVSMDTSSLIIAILIIQIVAIGGALAMARLSSRFGNFRVLTVTVFLWIGICLSAYFTYTVTQFYLLAVAVGLVMGGIQSISRSTYSKLLPITKDTTSFFSFYDVTEKLSIVLGMFSFGFIEHVTGNMRNSIVFLTIFFMIGAAALMFTMKKNRAYSVI